MINASYIYVLNITHTFFLSTIFPIFGFSYTGSSKWPKEHTDTDTSGPVSQHVWSLQVWTHGDRTGIFSALHDLIARLSLSSCRRHSHSRPACQQDAIKAPPHLLWLLSFLSPLRSFTRCLSAVIILRSISISDGGIWRCLRAALLGEETKETVSPERELIEAAGRPSYYGTEGLLWSVKTRMFLKVVKRESSTQNELKAGCVEHTHAHINKTVKKKKNSLWLGVAVTRHDPGPKMGVKSAHTQLLPSLVMKMRGFWLQNSAFSSRHGSAVGYCSISDLTLSITAQEI